MKKKKSKLKPKYRMSEFISKAIKRKKSGTSTKWKNIEGVKFWNPEPGTYKIDIIPAVVTWERTPDGYRKGDVIPWITYYQHSGISSEERTVVCPRTIGLECPICDYRAQLSSEDYEKHKDIIDQLKARERVLVNVIDLDNRDEGIQVFDISSFLFAQPILDEIELQEKEGTGEYVDFAHPEVGCTLKVRFKERKLGRSSFIEVDRVDFLPRKKQYDPDIIEEAYDLCSLLRIFPPDLLADLFFDKITVEEALEALSEIDDVVAYSKGLKKTRITVTEVVEEEEEAEEEEVYTDEEEGEIKPRRRRKPQVEEPEEEEEEEETEEEDEHDEEEVQEEEEEEIEEPEEEEEEGEEEAEEPPKNLKKVKRKCPFGHRFGVDTDEYEDCTNCPEEIWEACTAEWTRLQRKQRKK